MRTQPEPISPEKLLELRRKAGLTQEQLAKKLGIDQTAVSNWERGKCTPLQKFRKKLVKVLNCTLEDLLLEDEPKE